MKRGHIICSILFFLVLMNLSLFRTVYIKASSSTDNYITTQKKLVQEVHDYMTKWKSTFTVYYKGDIDKIFSDDLSDFFDKVFLIDDSTTSNDFDYLKNSIKSYSVDIKTSSNLNTLKFSIKYMETAAQHKTLNAFVTKALKSLKLSSKSKYKKIKAIHDYIVNRVSYDTTYSNYSAYTAAIKKSSVCQGYSLLFYKMATEAGLSVRCVSSDNHMWNIVKLGTKWYYVDTTWDDPVSSSPILIYDYFLIGTQTLKASDTSAHTLSQQFTTSAFKKRYPISKADYSAA